MTTLKVVTIGDGVSEPADYTTWAGWKAAEATDIGETGTDENHRLDVFTSAPDLSGFFEFDGFTGTDNEHRLQPRSLRHSALIPSP